MSDAVLSSCDIECSGFHVVFDADSIYLRDDEGEIVMWTQPEWTEDPTLVLAIAGAVDLGHTRGSGAVRAILRNAAPQAPNA